MKGFFQKTLGGLSLGYYVRNFLFGAIICACQFMLLSQNLSFGFIIYGLIATILYPYSRFVYESVVGFIVGDNLFAFNAIVFLIAKIFTMVMCWICGIFIAPIGLAYLYYYHTKNKTFD